MKKSLFFILIFFVFLLSACQMPFTTPTKSNTEKYIDSTAYVMKSSRDVDVSLVKTLSKAEEQNMDENEILNAIVNARNMQQNLYDEIDSEVSRYVHKEVKYQYLKLINDRISSYNTIIHGINGANYDYIMELLELHVDKTRNGEEKALGEINQILARSGALMRYTLLPSEQSLCPEPKPPKDGKKESKKEKEKREKKEKELKCIKKEEAEKILSEERKEIDALLK